MACGQSGVTIPSPGSAHQQVTVPPGGNGNGKFYVTTNTPPSGYLEICKSNANGVSGSFSFTVSGKTVTVPAGACSPAIQVPAGTQVVHENAQNGFAFVSASTTPASRLVSVDAASANVTVTVVAGDVSTQTIVTVVNKTVPVYGTVKVCQVTGAYVAEGTSFAFFNSDNSSILRVPAGAYPGGNCAVLAAQPTVGEQLTIAQSVPSGDQVTSIVVSPSGRIVGSPDLANGKVVLTVGSGVTEVTYTDASN